MEGTLPWYVKAKILKSRNLYKETVYSNPTFQSPLDADYAMDYLNDDTPPAPGMVKTINAAGKVEWKRYKQYTKDDILAAIEEVKAGKCSIGNSSGSSMGLSQN